MSDDGVTAHGRPLPLMAVLCGGAVLAAVPLIVPRVAPALPVGTLIISGVIVGLGFWLIALFTGLRRGPGWWTAASGALLIAGGALAGYNAGRIGHADSAADASTFAELKLNPDGTPLLPSAPARGPVSAAYVELVRGDERAAKAQADRVAKLNPGVLNSPYTLSQAPGILADCQAIDALAARAPDAEAAHVLEVAALAQAIDTSKLESTLRQGITEMAIVADGDAAALSKHERDSWQATRDLCVLLAKRGWTNANGFFGFASSADKAAFDSINQRRVEIEGEREATRDRIRTRFEAGREKVRAALS